MEITTPTYATASSDGRPSWPGDGPALGVES